MKKFFDIEGKTDEELLEEYSADLEGKTFVPSRLIDAIGQRKARLANRKPGDPGTIQNPVFINGKAFVYNSRNKLVLWEDYDCGGNAESSDTWFVLTAKMKPTEEQIRMVQTANNVPVIVTSDCPVISDDDLQRMKKFTLCRPRKMN